MRIRRSILWLTATAAVLVGLFIWFEREKPPAKTPLAATETNSAVFSTLDVTAEPSQPAPSPVQAASPPARTARDANAGAPPGESKEERMANVLSNYNDMPIVFYGKLEDQFSNPVPGAVVEFDIQYNTGYAVGVRRGQTVSDASGFFTISGYNGKSLSTNPKKLGYALASRNGGGIYSQLWPEEERIHPDPSNPVVIKMWRLQGAVPLVGIDKEYRLHYTDAPIHFDLLAGKVVPERGDLEVTVSRAPGVMSGRNPLDWSVKVEAVDGGVLETSMAQSRVTYAAPDDGYQPSAVFLFSTNAPHKWFGGFDQMFFAATQHGRVYSKVLFSININQDPDDLMYISFRGVASTNGSRNWEGDPNTMKPQ